MFPPPISKLQNAFVIWHIRSSHRSMLIQQKLWATHLHLIQACSLPNFFNNLWKYLPWETTGLGNCLGKVPCWSCKSPSSHSFKKMSFREKTEVWKMAGKETCSSKWNKLQFVLAFALARNRWTSWACELLKWAWRTAEEKTVLSNNRPLDPTHQAACVLRIYGCVFNFSDRICLDWGRLFNLWNNVFHNKCWNHIRIAPFILWAKPWLKGFGNPHKVLFAYCSFRKEKKNISLMKCNVEELPKIEAPYLPPHSFFLAN